jgi:tetratricopeptide (TPR) repeat protein
MKKHLIFLFLILCPYTILICSPDQSLEKGVVLPKILCEDSPENSYALFLPSAYKPEKKWPILYALDPAAQGHIPVDLFQRAAEKYNYILVGSNNSKNGPCQEVIQSLIVLWNDTNERFSIDKNRIYVTGFSGGSRAASIFSRIIMHPVAGIIGCGAGLAKSLIKPKQIHPAYYLGIIGMTDFNYREMMLLGDQLGQQGVDHRFLVHSGGHDWPAEDICQRAIEWMEIIGIRKKIRTKDKSLIDTIFQKEQEVALELETTGNLTHALSLFRTLEDTFNTWLDTGSIQAKILAIQTSDRYLKDEQDENRIKKQEIRYLRKFGQIFAQIEKNSPLVQDIESYLAKLELNELKALAADNRSTKDRYMAIRLLHGLEIDAGSKGWDFFQKGEFTKAIFLLEIAASGGNKDSLRKKNIYYNLACAFARIKNKKKALENLKMALELGFDDFGHIKRDEDLAFLRDSEEFQKLIKKQP